MLSFNLVAGLFSVVSLFFSLFKLIKIIVVLKKYAVIKEKVVDLHNKHNSKLFIQQSLLDAGFDEYLVEEAISEVFIN